MALYGLTDFQLLWERATDTKCGCMPVHMVSNFTALMAPCSSTTPHLYLYIARKALVRHVVPCAICRCILAWNDDTHIGVLAFRGTASVANALADLQVSLEQIHPSCIS